MTVYLRSGCFKDPEAFDLFEKLESRPAIEIMQHQKSVEIAIDLLVDSIERFQLIPDAPDPGPERRIDAISVDA